MRRSLGHRRCRLASRLAATGRRERGVYRCAPATDIENGERESAITAQGSETMKISSIAVVLVLFATLSGCATHGCTGVACKRPDSTNRELVIWWPPDMRDGLDDQDHERDYTVVKLKD
ncbi:HrpT [Pseudomonas savastanoi pv. glycinea]|nr:HrpT [Pseudomonas savastanoi pv. glycinea]RMP90430.1 HrpT [Pseudomonas savastanoi pv. glycinea]RMQ05452.1 HrpT [Pseudomonas savastanoi pv. glycinea]RMW30999.1 HrpT [Pseudomonas savastanoi pv. glycinea]